MPESPDVSIVIVNYNTCEKLRACLQSLITHYGNRPDISLEVLVVDNGSKDNSRDMVRSLESPMIQLIAPEANTWFTGGNNLGMQAATGHFIWILNPDTVVEADTLPVMLDYLRTHETVGAVTCRMEYPSGGLQRTTSQMPEYLDLLLGYTGLGVLLSGWRDARRRRMWYADWQRDSTRPVEVAPGSNILARRSLLQQLDYFDTAMKLYFCEDDLCQRIRQAGYAIHFVAGTRLWHHEHASVQQVQRLASQIYFDDLLVFCRRHYGYLRAGLLRLLLWPTRALMELVQRRRGEKDAL